MLAIGCGASSEAARPTAPTPTAAAASTTATPAASPAPEAVVRLRSADDFEKLRQGGQPTVLAILDEGYG